MLWFRMEEKHSNRKHIRKGDFKNGERTGKAGRGNPVPDQDLQGKSGSEPSEHESPAGRHLRIHRQKRRREIHHAENALRACKAHGGGNPDFWKARPQPLRGKADWMPD